MNATPLGRAAGSYAPVNGLNMYYSTLLYLVMWQIKAPLWGWAIASILIGLGFTFFSGATGAWLVDALAFSGFDGNLESVFAKGQTVGGVVAQPALGRVADVAGYSSSYLLSAIIQVAALPFLALARRENAPSDPIDAQHPENT